MVINLKDYIPLDDNIGILWTFGTTVNKNSEIVVFIPIDPFITCSLNITNYKMTYLYGKAVQVINLINYIVNDINNSKAAVKLIILLNNEPSCKNNDIISTMAIKMNSVIEDVGYESLGVSIINQSVNDILASLRILGKNMYANSTITINTEQLSGTIPQIFKLSILRVFDPFWRYTYRDVAVLTSKWKDYPMTDNPDIIDYVSDFMASVLNTYAAGIIDKKEAKEVPEEIKEIIAPEGTRKEDCVKILEDEIINRMVMVPPWLIDNFYRKGKSPGRLIYVPYYPSNYKYAAESSRVQEIVITNKDVVYQLTRQYFEYDFYDVAEKIKCVASNVMKSLWPGRYKEVQFKLAVLDQ